MFLAYSLLQQAVLFPCSFLDRVVASPSLVRLTPFLGAGAYTESSHIVSKELPALEPVVIGVRHMKGALLAGATSESKPTRMFWNSMFHVEVVPPSADR